MGFSVLCNGYGKLLYQGRDLIPLYRLRRRTDGKCPGCGRKLAIRPLSISYEKTDVENAAGTAASEVMILRKLLSMKIRDIEK